MKTVVLNEELFDGPEGNFVNLKSVLTIGADQLKISFEDFSNNDFRNLEGFLSEADMEKLVRELDLRPFIFDGKTYYNDKRGIKIHYCIKGKYLVILSFGESQPARYMIFALGAAIMD